MSVQGQIEALAGPDRGPSGRRSGHPPSDPRAGRGRRRRGRLRGSRARPAHPPQRRRLPAPDPRRPQRLGRGGRLGGGRRVLRLHRSRHGGLRRGPVLGASSIRGQDHDPLDPHRAPRTSTRDEDLAEGPPVSAEALEEDAARAAGHDPESAAAPRCSTASSPPSSRIWRRFRVAPAAKYYHQAYRHGLLDHTVSVAQAVSAAAAAFPGIDRDVAITGALLHDIGKTQAYNDDPLAIDLTDAGRLLGRDPARLLHRPPHDRVDRRLRPRAREGGAPHRPLPPRQARERLPGRARDPRGDPRARDGQPRAARSAASTGSSASSPTARRGRASTAGSTRPRTSAAARGLTETPGSPQPVRGRSG